MQFPARLKKMATSLSTNGSGYLSLIQGKPQIKGSTNQADMLQNRVRYHVFPRGQDVFMCRHRKIITLPEHAVIRLHFSSAGAGAIHCKENIPMPASKQESRTVYSFAVESHWYFDVLRPCAYFLRDYGQCAAIGAKDRETCAQRGWTHKNLTWAKDLAEPEHPPYIDFGV